MFIVSHPLYVPLPPPTSKQARPVDEIVSAASVLDPGGQYLFCKGRRPRPDLTAYITELQTVDPLRPVPWAKIMKMCGFDEGISADPFLNVAVAPRGSTVPIIDMACYPLNALGVIKWANPGTPLSESDENHFQGVVLGALNSGRLTFRRTQTLYFLFIRPEPESELSWRVRELMGSPTAAPEEETREIRGGPGQMNDFLSLLGTDLLLPIMKAITSFRPQMRRRVIQSVRIGRWNPASDREGEWAMVTISVVEN